MAVNKITEAMLKGAPTLAAVLKDFDAQFDPRKVLLASYVSFTDRWFMKTAYKTAGLSWRFDHHVFDLWPIFFLHRAATDGLRPSKKRFAGFGLEVLKKDLKMSSGKLHDALTDCRVEAEVLRRILKKFSAKK
jgi:DNA polymerase III epsilon subunit-like protein